MWDNGKQHGEGKLITSKGLVKQGSWENGKLIGSRMSDFSMSDVGTPHGSPTKSLR